MYNVPIASKIALMYLQVLYPSKKYDSEITRQLDALIIEFTTEIKSVHHRDNTQDNLNKYLENPFQICFTVLLVKPINVL